jgi:hypothetical protein
MYVAFEVVEIVAVMVQGLSLIVSPSTAPLSQILDPSGRLETAVPTTAVKETHSVVSENRSVYVV